MLVTAPHISVYGDNTTPISNVGNVADVSSSPGGAGADLSVQTMFSGLSLTPKRLSSRPNPHHLGPCNPELGLA